MSILVFGHRNPDTDSITSALALTYLKNQLIKHSEVDSKRQDSYTACRLGDINKETEFVLNYFELPIPMYIDNVKTQVKDVPYFKFEPFTIQTSIISAIRTLHDNNLRALAVVNKDNKIIGIISLQDIAITLVTRDTNALETNMKNLIEGLDGRILNAAKETFKGNVIVLSLFAGTIIENELVTEKSIVIVGDRYDIIEHSIDMNVQLIVSTCGFDIPDNLLEKAKERGVSVITTNLDTYSTSKIIGQCNFAYPYMKTEHIIMFEENDSLEIVANEIKNSTQPYFPIIDSKDRYLGMFSRNNLILQQGKKVILVDHNEYTQSAEGLKEANILEIYDHHKIGDIRTANPINFRNIPVGSTNTIVYNTFRENNVVPPENIAGAMLSGIISDTLMLTSPTTTDSDRKAIAELKELVNIDVEKFSRQLFRAGTSIHGMSVEELFRTDCKVFEIDDRRVFISQLFTLDIEHIMNLKVDLNELMTKIRRNERVSCILIVTDILKNGSYCFFEDSANDMLDLAFGRDVKNGDFLEGIVSRKKQIIPKIMAGMSLVNH